MKNTKKTTKVTEVKAEKTAKKAVVENSPKLTAKKAEKTAAPKTTGKATKTAEKTAEKATKPAVKKADNKVTTVEKPTKYSVEMARMFPKEIEVEGVGKLTAQPDKFHKMSELVDALNEGREIYIAAYWTARQIKQFDYEADNRVPCPKSFPNDLDILMATVTCSNIERVWCMSVYTEAMQGFDGADLVPVKDKDKDGEFQLRVVNGLEFEIYEKLSK